MHQSSVFWVKGEILHAHEGRKEEEAYLRVTLMQFIKNIYISKTNRPSYV